MRDNNDRTDSLKIARLMVAADLQLIDQYDPLIKELDRQILSLAKGHDPTSLHLLKSI